VPLQACSSFNSWQIIKNKDGGSVSQTNRKYVLLLYHNKLHGYIKVWETPSPCKDEGVLQETFPRKEGDVQRQSTVFQKIASSRNQTVHFLQDDLQPVDRED